MNPNQLTATSNSASQTVTQSPQSASAAGGNTADSAGVQPGTASALLNSQGGIQLRNTGVSTVSLNPTTFTSATSTQAHVAKHHVNLPLLGLAALLILAAIFLFWTSDRSVNSTT